MRDKNKGKLSIIELVLSGGALFSMHFGASSMVWPMNWGKESGSSVLAAFIGSFISSILFVFIVYLALSKGNYRDLTKKVLGEKMGRSYTGLTIAILGPLYVIPRMSAAAWDSFLHALSLILQALSLFLSLRFAFIF